MRLARRASATSGTPPAPAPHTAGLSTSSSEDDTLLGTSTTSGWLYKLGRGKSEGNDWKRRFFCLHGSALQYYPTMSPAASPSQRPKGVVLVDACQVAARDESAAADGSLRWGFSVFSMVTGDTLVLATETKAERARWMEALRGQSQPRGTGAAGPLDSQAATVPPEDAEQGPALADVAEASGAAQAAEMAEAEAAREGAELALHAEESAAHAARATVQSAATAQRRAEAQLAQARARLQLRQSLLHWRERTLRRVFVALVGAVFATKIDAVASPL